MATADIDTALALLKRHEEEMGFTYQAVAERFPYSADFWNGLAHEEAGHAGWVQQIIDAVAGGAIVTLSSRFSVRSFEEALKYMQQVRRIASFGGITEATALSMGMDLEDASDESNIPSLFVTDDPHVTELLARIKAGYRTHYLVFVERFERTHGFLRHRNLLAGDE
jgi:hypothetical protein